MCQLRTSDSRTAGFSWPRDEGVARALGTCHALAAINNCLSMGKSLGRAW